jgi:hypothetical protein
VKPRIFATPIRFCEFIDSCASNFLSANLHGCFINGEVYRLEFTHSEGDILVFNAVTYMKNGKSRVTGIATLRNGFRKDECGNDVSIYQSIAPSASATDQSPA